MDFSFTQADEEFRMNVRHFFETEYPRDIIDKIAKGASPTKEDYQRSDARWTPGAGWP